MFKLKNKTMKKTYQNPQIQLVKLQTAQIIATSPGYGGSTTSTSGNLSRSFDYYDDED